MTTHKIYSVTSIGRPIVWAVPTNRAMLILLGPSAAVAFGLALWLGAPVTGALVFALSAALAAFGGWALGREFDPDDQAAAFVALALSLVVILFIGPMGGGHYLLVLFTTLGLVRQVNRSTGLEARISDSLLLLGLTLWVVYGTANPLFAIAAGFSFALDGLLDRPLRRQWLFALLSFGATIVYMVDHDLGRDVYSVPQSLPQWLAALTAVVFALNSFRIRKVQSTGDVHRRPLDPMRVRGGIAVAVIVVAQGLPEVREIALIAGAMAGMCLTAAFRRSFRSPA